MKKADVYQIVTDRIIESLEQGVIPWKKPWSSKWQTSEPHNFISKKPYRGMNIWMLMMAPYSCPAWATFKQIKAKGGTVRKGEKGTPVIYWNFLMLDENDKPTQDPAKAKKKIPLLKYYTVFNLEQCEGIEIEAVEEADHVNQIEACEKIMNDWKDKPEIKSADSAYYKPSADYIGMPEINRFENSEAYYATLFHEAIHATGHHSRLDRSGLMSKAAFGSEVYAKEELVAEMGAAFLCGKTGIEDRTVDNHASYIKSWISKLKEDSKLLINAASKAQKAADYIMEGGK